MIYSHGFNNDENAASAFHNEAYKRLYHSGSNALFTGIHWHGDEGIPAGPNYWDNVENAFYTADDFASLVNGISGDKTIIAHSLGNMVVSSAIQDFNMAFDKYFMLDPAVALEAYQGNVAHPIQMRHPDWDEFYFGADYDANADTETYTDQGGRRLWSVEWHTLFADERKTLTWRNRFEAVGNKPNIVQYFSTGEEVLRPDEEGTPNSFDPVTGLFEDLWIIGWFIDEPPGFNAWNVQEKSKGTDNLASFAGGDTRAGWGFNCAYEATGSNNEICYSFGGKTHIEAQAFFDSPDSALIAAPYFDPFNNPVLMNPDTILDKTIVNKNYPKNLGYDIPALSFAAGGTRSTAFTDEQAFDMNSEMADGWPKSRLDKYGAKEWWHSDFKDVAYRYTYKLFDNLVEKGALNETQ